MLSKGDTYLDWCDGYLQVLKLLKKVTGHEGYVGGKTDAVRRVQKSGNDLPDMFNL